MKDTDNCEKESSKWFADNAKPRFLVDSIKRSAFKGMYADPNIIGMAYGRREAHGERTDEPALVVYVAKKMSSRFLPPSRMIPRRQFVGGDCIEVDVVETGFWYPSSFTMRDRPALQGSSIGNGNTASAGTLGCLVIDNTDGTTNILSCNHVMVVNNALASLGDPIVQQGVFDGGSAPADTIATLKRFVTLNAAGNTVDAAIAQLTAAGNAQNRVKDDLMAVAGSTHPAVGLYFADSCSRSLMNPINNVLNQLNISFPGSAVGAAQPTVAPQIGLNVEKVGRTTEYTTSTIKEIDVSLTLSYTFGSAALTNQIATGWMGDQGDSGSLVCAGGNGGDINNCGACGSESSAAELAGRDVRTEGKLARDIRDKYLRHTKIGRWAVNLFYVNEPAFQGRLRNTKIDPADIEFGRTLLARYEEDARVLAVAPERGEQKVTKSHMRDAARALKRAKKYMTSEEAAVADRLFEMGTERLLGKTAREAMALLQDSELLAELQKLVEAVPTLDTKECGCRK